MIKPTKNTQEQTKAIVDVGFFNKPELELSNPFIKRQKEIAEEIKVKKLTQRNNNEMEDKVNDFLQFKITETSLQPHLTSTFNMSMPFKDSLLNSNINSPSQPSNSTVYAKGPKQGFMFGAKKSEKQKCNSPKFEAV